MTPVTVGVVTGLTRESACFDQFDPESRPDVRCSGADSLRAVECALSLIADGCRGLVSFGMAGGLSSDKRLSADPLLEPGALIIPQAIVDGSGLRTPVDAEWRARLTEVLSKRYSIHDADIVGVDAAVTTAAAKAKLRAASDAVAVDMESHRVAALATRTGVPFVVIRAVSDSADRRIPPWAMAGVRADGSVAMAAMIGGALTHPLDIPGLIGLARDSAKALATLRGVVGLLGPKLGLL